eukprot:jgi/Chrzof1/3554/Cz13g00060.t1
MRLVCHEWRDTITLGAREAEMDLAPDSPDETSTAAKRSHFFKSCPLLKSLTYHVSPKVSLAKFEVGIQELASRLPRLGRLVLVFNNAAQQFETRHLAALTCLPHLRSVTLQANFHPDACSFSVLSALTGLEELRILPSDACTGLTDSHVQSLAALPHLARLEFPGHARAFTGATLAALVHLPRLKSLTISSSKPQHVDYTLSAAAVAGLRALTHRSGRAPALAIEVGVPDATWVTQLLKACEGAGLARLGVSVREAADASQIAGLSSAPAAAVKLTGLDIECRGAPTPEDVRALSQLTSLERLFITCKCVRPPRDKLDLVDWAPLTKLRHFHLHIVQAPLTKLRHFHLHINPAWRRPLQPATLETLATAWPSLERLHLRLSSADNTTHALYQLRHFKSLRALSLQWLVALMVLCSTWASLPARLTELQLTSINAVRLVVPKTEEGEGLGHLESLSLDGNFGVCDDLLASLCSQLPLLQHLALVLLGRQTLSAIGLRSVAQLPVLGSLVVQDYREAPLCLSQACLNGLSGLATLRQLKLSTPDIVHAELQPDVFTGFSKLRRLELVGCQEQAAAALSDHLPLCCMRPRPDWAGEEGQQQAVAVQA